MVFLSNSQPNNLYWRNNYTDKNIFEVIKIKQQRASIMRNQSNFLSNPSLRTISTNDNIAKNSSEFRYLSLENLKNSAGRQIITTRILTGADKQNLILRLEDAQRKINIEVNKNQNLIKENHELRKRIDCLTQLKGNQFNKNNQIVSQQTNKHNQKLKSVLQELQQCKKSCFQNEEVIRLLHVQLNQKIVLIQKYTHELKKHKNNNLKVIEERIKKQIQIEMKTKFQAEINYYIKKIQSTELELRQFKQIAESKKQQSCLNCKRIGRSLIVLNSELRRLREVKQPNSIFVIN